MPLRRFLSRMFKASKREARTERLEIESRQKINGPMSETDLTRHAMAGIEEKMSGKMHRAFADPEAKRKLREIQRIRREKAKQ